MSSVDSNANIIDLKDGHAAKPAVKVAGGVRIPQKHHSKNHGEKQRSNSETAEDADEQTSTSPKQTHPIISGAQTKGDKDFSTSAIKSYHEKPLKNVNVQNGSNLKIIQQPKKF